MSYDDEKCVRPPHGWKCSRGNGHPGPCAARPARDVGLIERCAQAVWREWTGRDWAHVDQVNRSLSMAVARAVLAEASTPPPAALAPITAEDVWAALKGWDETWTWHGYAGDRAAFVAEWLNRRQR